jgi:hypothetical protein
LVHQNEKRQGETQSHCPGNGQSRKSLQRSHSENIFTVIVTEWLSCSIWNN